MQQAGSRGSAVILGCFQHPAAKKPWEIWSDLSTEAGAWTRWSPEVPCNLNYFLILWSKLSTRHIKTQSVYCKPHHFQAGNSREQKVSLPDFATPFSTSFTHHHRLQTHSLQNSEQFWLRKGTTQNSMEEEAFPVSTGMKRSLFYTQTKSIFIFHSSKNASQQ